MDAFSARSPPAPAAIQPRRVYDLPKLIDLAQQTNPETRATWQEARAAAARLGIAEGAYLPTLGAIGVASYAHLPDNDKMGPFWLAPVCWSYSRAWIGCCWTRSTQRRSRQRGPGVDRLCRFPVASVIASVRPCPRRRDEVRIRHRARRLWQRHGANPAMNRREAGAVADQTAGRGVLAARVDHRNGMLRGQMGELLEQNPKSCTLPRQGTRV